MENRPLLPRSFRLLALRPLAPRLALTLLGALGLGAAVSTCKVYPDSLLDPRPDQGNTAGSSGVDAGTGVGFWSGTNADGCFSAGQPTEEMRPAPSDAPPIDPVYFAVSKLLLGSQNPEGVTDKNAWANFGFDLDGICTTSPTCPAASPDAEEPRSCKSINKAQTYDGNYCRDNTFGFMEYFVTTIPELGERYNLNDTSFNCGLCHGQYNILIRVSDYNGQANDDQVRVDLYSSPGLEHPLDLSCADLAGATPLCFLGTDPWMVDEASMDSPKDGPDLSDAKIFDSNAYVRDGYLVAHFPEKALIRFPDTNAPIRPYPLYLTKGLVTAKISKGKGGVWELTDGTIAGRVTGDDIVKGFREVGFCESDKSYGLMTQYTKASLDLLASGDIDPEKPCDALSMGVVFTATQATAGKTAKVEPLIDCPPPKGGAAGAAGAGGEGGAAGGGM